MNKLLKSEEEQNVPFQNKAFVCQEEDREWGWRSGGLGLEGDHNRAEKDEEERKRESGAAVIFVLQTLMRKP